MLNKTSRLMSLDFFRGLSIASMILVNNSIGESYPQLRHAAWNGWTLADTIFPFFLWIIGVSMVFSFTKRLDGGESKRKLLWHVFRRSLILFVLGFFLNLLPYFNFSTVRIFGVLQRIAICYFFSSIIFLWTKWKGQIFWTLILLISYLLLLIIPFTSNNILLEEGNNIVQYVDNLVLKGHMWKADLDPEGVLSTIPAIATVLFGILTGHLLLQKTNSLKKTLQMFMFGFSLLSFGLLLSLWLPINKNLWTSSYAVFMAGFSLIIFTICYFLIDVKKLPTKISNMYFLSMLENSSFRHVKNYRKLAKPLIIYGMNAITIYVLSIIIGILLSTMKVKGIAINTLIYQNYALILSSANASLLYALTNVVVLYFISYYLYKRNWFLKI